MEQIMIAKNPSISVILTTYNCESRIYRTVSSILNQTFDAIELLIIDDHSTDATVEICQSLQAAYSSKNISLYVNAENFGPAFSRNLGIQKSSGEYLILLDDDDIYSPLMLELAYKKAIQNKSDIVVVGSQSFNVKNNETYIFDNIKINPNMLNSIFSYKDINENFFESFTWWAWDKLIKRTLITENNLSFQNIRSSEDLSFTCKVFFNARRICIEPQILVTHILNRPNSISSSRKSSYGFVLDALTDLKVYMQKTGIYPALEKDFLYYSVNFIFWHQSTIQYPENILLCQKTLSFFRDTNIKIDSFAETEIQQKYLHICMMAGEEAILDLINTINTDIAQSGTPTPKELQSFISMLAALVQFIRTNHFSLHKR